MAVSIASLCHHIVYSSLIISCIDSLIFVFTLYLCHVEVSSSVHYFMHIVYFVEILAVCSFSLKPCFLYPKSFLPLSTRQDPGARITVGHLVSVRRLFPATSMFAQAVVGRGSPVRERRLVSWRGRRAGPGQPPLSSTRELFN